MKHDDSKITTFIFITLINSQKRLDMSTITVISKICQIIYNLFNKCISR